MLQGGLGFAQQPGRLNELPVRQRGEMRDPQVNADLTVRRREGFWLGVDIMFPGPSLAKNREIVMT